MKLTKTLKQGTYFDTGEQEYRDWPGVNYSALARFNESQDHALMEWKAKSYFEEGTAFELLIQDRAQGSNLFGERFFIADAPGEMPSGLAGWIENGERLGGRYRRNKDGTLNQGSKRLHAWIDECRRNKGKMPIGRDRIKILNTMVDNFMCMQPFANFGEFSTMEEVLKIAEFQVPIVWYLGKVRKKALIDVLIITQNIIFAFDIKSTADLSRFSWMLKDKYWIQEAHYCAGLGQIFPDKQIIWLFLASSKAEPWISQPFRVDEFSMSDSGLQAYYDLCVKYQAWIDEGKPSKGWKELKSVRVFWD